MDLELVSTTDLLHEVSRRCSGVLFVGRPLAQQEDYDFTIHSTGGTLTDIIGMTEIAKNRLLAMDLEMTQERLAELDDEDDEEEEEGPTL